MFKFKIDIYLNIVFLISLISLISAYFIEYFLGYQPCNLCLIERIPYWLGIILIILNYSFNKNEYFIILLLILIFSFSLIISLYHFGIEQGFFEESAVCGIKDFNENLTKEDLLIQLKEQVISCKDVTFRIFGLSLTSINMLFSLLIFVMLTTIYFKYEKNR